MQGLMMDRPLLVSGLIEHAERFHGGTEIVSKTVEGAVHRYGYRDAHSRAKRVAKALSALGVGMHDRVGTLAWNSYRHFEIYYGVAGSGAVIHTINPRLFPEQIVYIANHAEDKVVFYDTTFQPLVEKLRPQVKTVQHWIPLNQEYEALLEKQRRRLRVAVVRREDRGLPVLHLRHHRQSQGRALQPPLHHDPRLRRGAARHARPVGARGGAAGGADVPRQRLEPAVLVRDGGREDGVSRAAPRRQEPARAVRAGRGDDERRRADGVARAARLHEGEEAALLDAQARGDRRLGLPAGDDQDLPGRVRRAGAARLGHDRDEPARHRGHLPRQASEAAQGAARCAGRTSRAAPSTASTCASSTRTAKSCPGTARPSATCRCAGRG